MKKVFIAIVLCMFLAVPLSGCQKGLPYDYSASITMQVIAKNSGVVQAFGFPAQTEQLKKSGASADQISKYIDELVDNVRLKIWNKMFLNYFSVYSQSPNNDYVIGGKQVVFNQVQYNPSNDLVVFSFNFNSYAAWNYYHPATDEEKPAEDEGNLFLKVDVSKGVFPFAQSVNGQSVGNMYAQIISDAQSNNFSQEVCISQPKPAFCYDYATVHKRLHSNADVKFEDEYYHHIWQSDYEELANEKSVEIKTVSANKGWWYITTLGIVLGIVAIGAITIFAIKRVQKKAKQ